MTTMAGPRKIISIYDYPEHLNPFREEDNHNKIRFWTIGRKLSRSNSITFKDLKNSWSLRSFMRKGKKEKADSKTNNQPNGDSSPIIYRRALQYSTAAGARSTVSSPERADRYMYGGSVTPLPRSRFQERLRSPSQYEVSSISTTPRMARSDITGSRLSVESTNPFDEAPVPPVRASRRKKKRAPLPPPDTTVSADITVKEQIELRTTETKDQQEPNKIVDDEIEDVNLNIELKIIEDEDVKNKSSLTTSVTNQDISTEEKNIVSSDDTEDIEKKVSAELEDNNVKGERTSEVKSADSEDDILNMVNFPKVDITKYRRNSSVNDDDIRLRRGNLEDFHSLSNKRSKSLTNALDGSYVSYDINLNEDKAKIDMNSNEEPQKVVCKLYDDPRKKSVDHSLSSTENEFMEIDKATRELEREISKLNSALIEDDITTQGERLSVSDIRHKFDKPDVSSPNPIPKPRRSHYGDSNSHVNGNLKT
ncbi:unnamed protein product [Parnassius apollo]|uniref:(apollo) hypothetical protein n=1 Tax=Parnassius apollo TaxID=110799 RepID=A0A8S3WS26_PARAO|nr:unnamed protein product [Parnassius apollo]